MDSPYSGTRRGFLGTLCTAGITASLAGCGTLGSTDERNLRIGTLHPPVTLDPITAEDVGSAWAIGNIFDGLYAYGSGTDIRPQIADGPPRKKGDRTIVVTLNDAAKFQNGDPITAEDVKYSFESPLVEDTAPKGTVSAIESVETVDDRTVRFEFDHPYPALDRTLTRPIVPKAVRETDTEQFATDPVGSGPFEVGSFSEEKSVELTRWSEYWGDPAPAIDRVAIVYIESPITAMMSLKSNRTDIIEPVSPQLRDQMSSVTGANVATREGNHSYYFGFNHNQGPTTDPTVREAISHCIDLDTAVEDFVSPMGRRQYGPLPPLVTDRWEFPQQQWRSLTNERDTAKAKRLFEQADAELGRPTILTSKDPRLKEFGERLARGLRDAGQAALVEPVPWKTYLERYVSGSEEDYAIFVGEIAGTDDPDSYLYPVVHENMQGLTNGLFYNEDAVMNALMNARQTTDRERRRSLYASAIHRLLTDNVLLPICSVRDSLAHDDTVRGLDVHPITQLNPRVVSPTGAVTRGRET